MHGTKELHKNLEDTMIPIRQIPFTEIEDIQVGHAHNLDAATGCTVVICEKGATAGVDVRGGAPGTRETDLLDPVNLVEKIHAVVLAGGSAFGLDAASGVMQYLEERKIGFDVGVARVPIVCGAVLFDLTIGDHRVRPDREMGYQACRNVVNGTCAEGNVGAGAGATVGKIRGMDRAMKSGLGCHAIQVGQLKIGALVAVNCLGDVIDPETGERLAGLLNEDRTGLADTEAVMIQSYRRKEDPLFRQHNHRYHCHQCDLNQVPGHQAGLHGPQWLCPNHASGALHVRRGHYFYHGDGACRGGCECSRSLGGKDNGASRGFGGREGPASPGSQVPGGSDGVKEPSFIRHLGRAERSALPGVCACKTIRIGTQHWPLLKSR